MIITSEIYVLFINRLRMIGIFFFFNDTATTEIYTLSLHDALPILPVLRHGEIPIRSQPERARDRRAGGRRRATAGGGGPAISDRKRNRLNSSPLLNSNAAFCLKKKKKINL